MRERNRRGRKETILIMLHNAHVNRLARQYTVTYTLFKPRLPAPFQPPGVPEKHFCLRSRTRRKDARQFRNRSAIKAQSYEALMIKSLHFVESPGSVDT